MVLALALSRCVLFRDISHHCDQAFISVASQLCVDIFLQEIATRENLVEHGDLLLDQSTESEQVEAMRVPMGDVLDKVC